MERCQKRETKNLSFPKTYEIIEKNTLSSWSKKAWLPKNDYPAKF